MRTDQVGVAIVGVGGIAALHVAALRTSDVARLVAVCDVDADRAGQLAHAEGVCAVSSCAELLDLPDVEAVIVCTPNVTHRELGEQVLRAGRHLLMEKPLALTVADARSLATLARDSGLALAVGHSHRFSDQGRAIHEAISRGAVGTPQFVRVVMNGGWIWPGWQAWVLDPALSGGHALHNGIHLVDLASWWLGEPVVSVFAAGQHATSAALSIHDYLVMELGFASGAAAVCEISRAERPRGANLLELTVVGSEAVLTRAWDADGLRAWTEEGFATWAPDGSSARTFQAEIDAFADAVRGRAPVNPPTTEAVSAVAVAVAAE
uniref:Gfo/Idh/MocA family protein n=1 Tax=Pseudactinotalea sp. TaxID=1926260 RepID=UPI003B3AC8E4